MSSGYAIFQSKLNIKGTSKIDSNWSVVITSVNVNKTEGLAENVSTSFTDLTANMEANVYSKGDSVTYDVTIENKGTIDAKLDNVVSNTKTSNDAVLTTFSGYIKGQTLKAGTSQTINVTIEYNPYYDGDPKEGSSEIETSFNYVQPDQICKGDECKKVI